MTSREAQTVWPSDDHPGPGTLEGAPWKPPTEAEIIGYREPAPCPGCASTQERMGVLLRKYDNANALLKTVMRERDDALKDLDHLSKNHTVRVWLRSTDGAFGVLQAVAWIVAVVSTAAVVMSFILHGVHRPMTLRLLAVWFVLTGVLRSVGTVEAPATTEGIAAARSLPWGGPPRPPPPGLPPPPPHGA